MKYVILVIWRQRGVISVLDAKVTLEGPNPKKSIDITFNEIGPVVSGITAL